MSHRRVTIRDIARAAGVAPSTVSRALNGKARIGEATRRRILRLAARRAYRRDGLARGLVLRRSHTIGLIIPNIRNPIYAEMARGIEDVARQHGFTAFFLSTDDDAATARHAVETLCERRVDGIIYASARSGDPCLPLLTQARVPAVLMNRVDLRDPHLAARDSVVVDNARGASMGVEHLVRLGHRRIGVITGRRDLSTGVGRLAGVRRALRQFGIPADPQLVLPGEFRRDASYAACLHLLKLRRPPTALFALNDDMAIGAYEAILEAGLRVPGDVALLGFGNSDLTSIAGVGISTIDLRKYEIGRASVEILVDRIEGRPPKAPRQVVLEPRLVVRPSTAGARRAG